MKITKILTLTAAAVLLTAPVIQAQERVVHIWEEPGTWWNNRFVYNTTDRYAPNELTFDTFAAYVAGQSKFSRVFRTDIRDGTWGGGIGLNYFFLQNLGIGADAVALANRGNFVDSVSGSLIARFPIEPTGLAPYLFGGGGRITTPWDWTAHGGVGLEYRFNPGSGLFADGRYMWGDKSSDSLMLRTGLRFAF